MKKVFAWAGGVGGLIVVLGAMVWGVPTYLKSQVHDLYVAEATAAGAPEGVTNNSATIGAMQLQLNGMETRMIARDKVQAERDAVIMKYFADKAAGR